LNCQSAYAKALLVDYKALGQAQLSGDVLGAHRILLDAFDTDVRPLLEQIRIETGLRPDPIAAYRADKYAQKVAAERGTDSGAGGGFPT
ncbi:MAG: sugar isomerase, partial [Chloroflexota bacterium]